MRGQRERGGESGELAQEMRLPQCRDGEARLGPPLGLGVLAEAPASPTSWEESLGEGTESREDTTETSTHKGTQAACAERAEGARPLLQCLECRHLHGLPKLMQGSGMGLLQMGSPMPWSRGAGEEGKVSRGAAGH